MANRIINTASIAGGNQSREAELCEFLARLSSVSPLARKLLAHIAELAYHGRGQQRKPDTAYLPELHESCGLGVEEMYDLLRELDRAQFIELEDQYPFEDVKIRNSVSGWSPLAAMAQFSEREKAPLREMFEQRISGAR